MQKPATGQNKGNCEKALHRANSSNSKPENQALSPKKAPYSGSAIALPTPCRACGYGRGLIIIRHEDDLGFVRCGKCDSPQYSVRDRQVEEVAV